MVLEQQYDFIPNHSYSIIEVFCFVFGGQYFSLAPSGTLPHYATDYTTIDMHPSEKSLDYIKLTNTVGSLLGSIWSPAYRAKSIATT